MNRLPQELVDLLVTHLASILRQDYNLDHEPWTPSPQSLSPFARVSPKFQYAVERLTFREMLINSTDLDKFEATIARYEHRGRALKAVRYHIILPTHAPRPSARNETTWCRQRNCQAGLAAISRLLALLSQRPGAKAIRLSVRFNETGREVFQYKAEEQYFYSCLGFSNTQEKDKIPAALCVSHLYLGYGEGGQVTPDAMRGLVEKLTGVKKLSLLLREPDYFDEFRRRWRRDWAETLGSSGLAPSSTAISIGIIPPMYTYKEQVPRVHLGAGGDPLCSAVRSLGEGRKALRYAGMLEPSFFWPSADSEEPVPFWQTIEKMDLHMEMTAPTGCWYFKSPLDNSFGPSNGHPGPLPDLGLNPPGVSRHSALNELAIAALELEQQSRSATRLLATVMWERRMDDNVEPGERPGHYDADFPFEVDEREMAPLLEAMAKALAQMPRLRSFRLALDLGRFHPGNDAMTRRRRQPWAINYRAPREERGQLTYEMPGDGEEELVKVPRFYLHVGGWSPGENLLDLFREVGRRNHGREAVIVHHPPRSSGFAGEISAE